jgi:hypothetical protein
MKARPRHVNRHGRDKPGHDESESHRTGEPTPETSVTIWLTLTTRMRR